VKDLGDWKDDHVEKDLEESQRGSGQDAPACRCPLEQELLDRHLQRLAGVLGQCRELVHLNLSDNEMGAGQRTLQECWGSA
jgi:hypothetical protein